MAVCANALPRVLFSPRAAPPVVPLANWPKPVPALDAGLPRCEVALLNTRPREVDAPRPLPLDPSCVLPRPRPRGYALPLADDMAVTGEGYVFGLHL